MVSQAQRIGQLFFSKYSAQVAFGIHQNLLGFFIVADLHGGANTNTRDVAFRNNHFKLFSLILEGRNRRLLRGRRKLHFQIGIFFFQVFNPLQCLKVVGFQRGEFFSRGKLGVVVFC